MVSGVGGVEKQPNQLTMEEKKEMINPAFPFNRLNDTGKTDFQFTGISTRDYFAAKAMSGMVVGGSIEYDKGVGIAKVAYMMADAMLEERSNVQ